MTFTLGRTFALLAVIFFVIVLLGTAGSLGFFGSMFDGFGSMFDGFFGDMFGDMFGSTVDTLQPGSRPLPTATVRR